MSTHTGPAARGVGTHRVARDIDAAQLPHHASGLLADGFRLALVAAHDEPAPLRVVYLFLAAGPDRRIELHVTLDATDPTLPSLAAHSFPASRFEREMADLYGITALGHPAPRRLVRHAHWPEHWHPMRRDADAPPAFQDVGSFPFATVEHPGVFEIPVGPVHAGLIEPGHFRFSVVGETILKLKARLWFLHRGIEKLFHGRPATDATELAERISGDTSAAHALAHSHAIEDAQSITVPTQVHRLRALVLELERLYNHATDLGALANDVGFGLANSHAQRIREQLLRINETVTGHRLLRGAIHPGGVTLRALPDTAALAALAADLADLADTTLRNNLIRDRFAGTAILDLDQARDLGCLGYVARASGVATDARLDHPVLELPIRPVLATAGDVLARYQLRRDEYEASTALALHLTATATGPLHATAPPPAARPGRPRPDSPRSGVGIVEGWRGTIVHRVELDSDNRITRAKIVDPSWFNWPALPVALTNTIVPDFPLANKSFNLSYSGNDL